MNNVTQLTAEVAMTVSQRVVESWNTQQEALAARIAEKTQPDFLYGANLPFLVAANAAYLFIALVLYLWMQKREKRFELKPVLLFYNLSCVLLAGYVVWGIVVAKLENPGSFACNAVVRTKDGDFLAWVFWVFFAQKFWEFLDTFFFILRKSFRQVTFLHIFHHCSINIVIGVILPHDYNGDMFLPILLNAVVHVLMYSHYLVTALGINSWWKQYLTSLQLLQFCAISLQSTMAYVRGPTCGSPDYAKVLMIAYMGSMLALFGRFFLNAYVLRKPDQSLSGVLKRVEPKMHLITRTGTVTLDEGVTFVKLPANFPSTDGELSYHLTPIGSSMPNLYIAEEARNGEFGVAGGNAGGRVSWQVSASVMLPLPKPKPRPRCPPTPMQLGCGHSDSQQAELKKFS